MDNLGLILIIIFIIAMMILLVTIVNSDEQNKFNNIENTSTYLQPIFVPDINGKIQIIWIPHTI